MLQGEEPAGMRHHDWTVAADGWDADLRAGLVHFWSSYPARPQSELVNGLLEQVQE